MGGGEGGGDFGTNFRLSSTRREYNIILHIQCSLYITYILFQLIYNIYFHYAYDI